MEPGHLRLLLGSCVDQRRHPFGRLFVVVGSAAPASERKAAVCHSPYRTKRSSGANVVAALRVAERLGSGATVATVIVDSGLRYLSTDLYRD